MWKTNAYGEVRSYVRPRAERSLYWFGTPFTNWFGTDTQGDYRAHSEYRPLSPGCVSWFLIGQYELQRARTLHRKELHCTWRNSWLMQIQMSLYESTLWRLIRVYTVYSRNPFNEKWTFSVVWFWRTMAECWKPKPVQLYETITAIFNIWAGPWENVLCHMRTTKAHQSDQRLCCSLLR